MVVLLNKNACAGKAAKKWQMIENEMRRRFHRFEIVLTNNSTEEIVHHLAKGEKQFIAAGGDGTVNYLLNTLGNCLSLQELKLIQIGAVGLGSSNDFHKPFKKEKFVNNIPCRINFSKALYHDLGVVRWTNGTNREKVKYWINNASIGVTAEANYFFNNPHGILYQLKNKNTNAAILYAAIKTILNYENRSINLIDGNSQSTEIEVTNLGIIKNPHFSGSFCYDSPYERSNGKFFVHICQGMTVPQTLKTLYHLSQKKFCDLKGTTSFEREKIMLTSNRAFAVEYDGETVRTNNVHFSILNNAVQLCS